LWHKHILKYINTIILPVVFYGCQNCSLERRKHRLKRSENRVLRRIFGPNKDEVGINKRLEKKTESRGAFITRTLLLGDQIKEDDTGEKCSRFGKDEKYIQNSGWET
jgi:hypothetical protein